ncbi:MBL fold metallo-hydrolase [Salsipaludibacter albus]|uniref:MBL fold metallo-hydrolase n=1 Tax=Salsipaludibacter albus TaxID=2849650 RepID=UPI001EE45F63|nr:MBL fold metallo-hydrolase [Salsipaludibacter albus]
MAHHDDLARGSDGPPGTFREVADRVWVARYPWFDVNVTLVVGSAGAVVVDTHASGLAARQVVDDLGRVPGGRQVVAIVNTHEHFDHTFGNATMRSAFGDVPIHAHEVAAARTVSAGARVKAFYDADPDDPHRDEVLNTSIVPADRVFGTDATLDLGDRQVHLHHPGRGHTGGDLVVTVPDADVLLAGDLVEEAGPPAFGDDSFPLEWPGTLARIRQHLGPDSVVVPGHGAVVDPAFVRRQQDDLTRLADTIRASAGEGADPEDALHDGDWPWPAEMLVTAVRRGYDHLG